jgi:hypothetical protein
MITVLIIAILLETLMAVFKVLSNMVGNALEVAELRQTHAQKSAEMDTTWYNLLVMMTTSSMTTDAALTAHTKMVSTSTVPMLTTRPKVSSKLAMATTMVTWTAIAVMLQKMIVLLELEMVAQVVLTAVLCMVIVAQLPTFHQMDQTASKSVVIATTMLREQHVMMATKETEMDAQRLAQSRLVGNVTSTPITMLMSAMKSVMMV